MAQITTQDRLPMKDPGNPQEALYQLHNNNNNNTNKENPKQ
jgi:hypothetical protein